MAARRTARKPGSKAGKDGRKKYDHHSLYPTAESLLEAIEKYVDEKNEAGEPIVYAKMILDLGFRARRTWYDQKSRGEDFAAAIEYGRFVAEAGYEQLLINAKGSPVKYIFALKSIDPDTWNEKQLIESKNLNVNVEKTPEDRKVLMARLIAQMQERQIEEGKPLEKVINGEFSRVQEQKRLELAGANTKLKDPDFGLSDDDDPPDWI